MTEIVIAVAGKVSEYLVAPIGRQLGYLFCYRSHADDLRNKVQKLGKARDDVQMTVDESRRRGDEIRPIVLDWLKQVEEITGEAEELLMKKQNKISCFFNLKSSYELGREAYKKAQVIVEVQTGRDFPDGLSYYVPPRSATFKEYDCFESRASTLSKIMEALRDDKMKIIGVWGMGGVGKTTLLKQVAEQAKQEKLFTTLVYVPVSWTRELAKFEQGISNIQQHIADMLGLKFEVQTIPARACKLMERLKKENILIVLDDIWKEFDLVEVGILSSSKAQNDNGDQKKDCKIVLASRDEDLLLQRMGSQICFPLQHLSPEEAWQLFKKTATGDHDDHSLEENNNLDQLMQPTARQIVEECQGLPVAIVTIAKALKGKKMAVWKNALEELKSWAPTTIGGVEEKVYACLELSYNYLKGDALKSLFLLCGSLSYGDISMNQLLSYAMGLDLFDHIKSLEEARNKLVASVTTLKASSLLLDGEDHIDYLGRGASRLLFMDADNYESVRMHDVVRDVARNIASKHPHHRFKIIEDVGLECDWTDTDEFKYISLNCNAVLHELPHRLVCPKLQFFLLQNNSSDSLNIRIPNTFFEGLSQLKVLDFSGMAFTELPSTLQSLANLRTLRLDECKKLSRITVIGELKKLQVLSMAGSAIWQLPKEMEQLTNLRLLDLNDCWSLHVIPQKILSSLSRLECLFMKSSFSGWAAEEVSNGASNNACLTELNHLHHLRMIEIEIPSVKMVPKEAEFWQDITSYAIFIGGFHCSEGKKYKRPKTLRLRESAWSLLIMRNNIGIRKLLNKTEELEIRALEKVFHGPISVRSFDSLKTLKVQYCHGMKFLFLVSTAGGLSQLEDMTIEDCDAMQQILTFEGKSEIQEDEYAGTGTYLQLFPNLRSLKLYRLPMLGNFECFGSELETTSQGNLDSHVPFFSYQVLFSSLETLQFYKLPELREIWHQQLPLDSLSNLGILRVQHCPHLLNLIPCHLMRSFKNLKEMIVEDCEVLQHVFDLQGYDSNIVEILPKLEILKLEDLLGLKGIICNYEKNNSTRGRYSSLMPISFHNLKCLSIHNCREVDEDRGNVDIHIKDDVLFGEKVSFPNLEELNLGGLFKLKMIWHHQLSLESSFSKLRKIWAYDCPHLASLIPSHLIESFQNLKEVFVRDCDLKCVFDHRGFNGSILPKIEILYFKKLPELRFIICNNDNDNVKYLLSPLEFKDFHHLKELRIINCGTPLDEKVSISPNLEVLVLESFPKLKEIDFGILPKLKILDLRKLPKLSNIVSNMDDNASCKRCLFSPSTFKNFHNLEELRIEDCGMEDRKRDVYTLANGLVLSNEKVPVFLESRASTLNKIMDALRDDKINLIGVVGIGGAGKTTLMKQVAQQAMQNHLFIKQVYLDLSWIRYSDKLQEPPIVTIQRTIAEMLGWNFFWYSDEYTEESIRAVAVELKQILKKEKVLIILDHIWKEIDLEEIGISSYKDGDGENECKIVLISSDREALCKEKTGGQICFAVETLPPEEALTLFNKTIADPENILSEEVRSIAIKVVEECEGVPLAIVTIAKALKDETQLAVLWKWKNALEYLKINKNCELGKGRNNAMVVYSSCLEWSYTHNLKGDDLKSLLLLCGLLRYGDISMYHLLQYAVGLDSFDHMDSLEQARYRLLELVEILKASGWLLEGHGHGDRRHNNFDDVERDSSLLFADDADKKFVRMHHAVYDVVRDIAFREDARFKEWSEAGESKACTLISLQYCNNNNNNAVHDGLPQGLVCPKLQFFLSHNNNSPNPSLNIPVPNTFFEEKKNLQVLELPGMRFTTLPSSLDSLANLRTLCLELDSIVGIGKLKKLQVLSLAGSRIERLSDEMTQLSNLRLLDLNRCWRLYMIPRNILSSLSRLECLFMREGFVGWAKEGDQSDGNACLSELDHMSCLTTLSIRILDAKLLPKNIQLKNLTRYVIRIGDRFNGCEFHRTWKGCRTNRTLKLKDVQYYRCLKLGDGISKLLERSKELEFEELSGTKHVLHLPNGRSFAELKHLQVSYSPEIQCIIYARDQLYHQHHAAFPRLGSLVLDDIQYTTDSMDQQAFQQQDAAFPILESLVLEKLDNLQQLWHGRPIPIRSFGNLKTLHVYLCPKLRYLFWLSTARGLSQLESMTIIDCKAMQKIIVCERDLEDEYEYGTGTNTNLELFPNLRTLKLKNLPELINFSAELQTSSTSLSCTNVRPEDSYFSHKVSFSKLEKLELHQLPKFKDLWFL